MIDLKRPKIQRTLSNLLIFFRRCQIEVELKNRMKVALGTQSKVRSKVKCVPS